MEQLQRLNFKQLYQLAKEYNVRRRSKMLKRELVQALFDMNIVIPDPTPTPQPTPTVTPITNTQNQPPVPETDLPQTPTTHIPETDLPQTPPTPIPQPAPISTPRKNISKPQPKPIPSPKAINKNSKVTERIKYYESLEDPTNKNTPKQLKIPLPKTINKNAKVADKIKYYDSITVNINKNITNKSQRKPTKTIIKTYKVEDRKKFYESLKDLTNKNIISPTSRKNVSESVGDKEEDFTLKEQETAMKGYLKTYRIDGQKGYDPKMFINKIKPKVIDLINQKKKPIKVKFILTCKLMKKSLLTNRIVEETEKFFHSLMEIITESDDLSNLFDTMRNHILKEYEQFLSNGYKWKFNYVECFDIHIDPYNPLSGSSYIPLPKKLALKKAIINVNNENDNECFKWAVTSAVFPIEKNPQRLNKQMRENSEKFDWKGIEFPVSLKQINKFESQNPYGINVFGYKNNGSYIIRRSKKLGVTKIRLLLITNGETSHYCWIKNMSRFINYNKDGHARFHCDNCQYSCYTEKSLKEHEEYCLNNEAVKIVMPKDKDGNPKYICFNNFNNKMRVPFVTYVDFESITEKIDTCSPDKSKSFTNQYQKHKPSGYCYYIKCFDDEIFKSKPIQYTANSSDEDVAQKFVNELEKEIRKIYNKTIKPGISKFKKMKLKDMPEKDKKDYKNATHCHICEGELGGDKVLDHCHLTGKYRGAAHNECNLKYIIPKFFPVIIHNLSGYDSHLFIKNLGATEGKINCIPNNEEKYISFTKQIVVDTIEIEEKKWDEKEKKWVYVIKWHEVKRDIRFIDSFKFMSTSLSSLVDNLTKCGKCDVCRGVLSGSRCLSPTDEKLTETKKEFKDKTNMMLRKGVFPYDYFDSLDKLNETQLPPKEVFYSKLNDEHITEDDYQHAKKVWKTFDMKTMREYHDIYDKSDVLQLADVFENYRDVCQNNYNLDPAWYFTAPGLAWDAALKLTKVKLELFKDVNMLLMVEKGIRGGVSQISKRYAKANNPYMKEYDPNQPIIYIIDLDRNNLYGEGMSKPLPTHGFRWMDDQELTNWKNIPCILEVDLEYPHHLHDLHSDYPLAPERLIVNKVEKLIPNLYNKTKYVVHRETLKLYESLGLKVTKINRGIKFEESAWLKPYIDLNTNLRSKANNDFEKDFFKLMNNSVFGKTMENIRKRVDIRLVTNKKDAKKLISKPNYHHRTIFCENLVAIHMKKTEIKFNKPVYLGMCILDLSKKVMYDFQYNYIKPKYDEKSKLLFTDTDSLVYEIETEDFYKDISPDVREMFDTSNYPKVHPSGIETGVNKKLIGKFKDEAGGEQINEFVGLGSKQYSIKMDNGKEIKKDKGVKASVVKNEISHDDYRDCLFTKEPQMRHECNKKS